jgi:membrane-bound inhibitor of C-type lysozyme
MQADRWTGSAAVVAVALIIAACSPAPPKSSPSTENRVRFSCANGEEIEVVFQADGGSATLTRGGTTEQLPQQVVASGFLYSNGRIGIRGKGRELQLEIGRMAPIPCAAI